MVLEVLDPKKLSLNDMMLGLDELYFLHFSPEVISTGESRNPGQPVLTPMNTGSLGLLSEESLILKITSEEDTDEEVVEEPTEIKTRRTRAPYRTYKLYSHDPTENIFVEFRPQEGDIRVNFKDKESAQAYFEYFREQFYTSTTGASVITVSNIYKDLNLVNWDPKDSDDWGWFTLDAGKCRYITEVLKTKNTKMWGFTLKHPVKLYESKKRDE